MANDHSEYRRRYYLAHREEEVKRVREWKKKNPKKWARHNRRYYQKHIVKIRELHREYKARCRKSDPVYRMRDNVRRRIHHAITRLRLKKTRRTPAFLGCDTDTLRRHLESKFKPGMTWQNYGQWHIDHIIPLAEGKTERQLNKLCHYTNLAPLWAHENLRKGKKRTWPSSRLHRPHTELR
jgi:hypothetical protein